MKSHNFEDSREKSENPIVLEFLDNLYQRIWPDADIQRITGKGILDIQLQKAGIDLVLRLNGIGMDYYLDEKIRFEDYGDILLEEYSNWEEKIPGWLKENKRIDLLPYVIWPRRQVYILPYPMLRLAYLANEQSWLDIFGRILVENKDYHTSNIPIPWADLKKALWESMTWKP